MMDGDAHEVPYVRGLCNSASYPSSRRTSPDGASNRTDGLGLDAMCRPLSRRYLPLGDDAGGQAAPSASPRFELAAGATGSASAAVATISRRRGSPRSPMAKVT